MDKVEEAFLATPRENFVPRELKKDAWIDHALPIGYGQTISQPSTVEMMLRWLQPQPGNKVLDIGSGSGWTAALLSRIIGPKGRVYAVELISELVEFGRNNSRRLGIKNAKFYKSGQELGLAKHAPYDRILVSAAAEKFPDSLLEQLKLEGKMIVPVKNDIIEVKKEKNGQFEATVHQGFVFVPLIV
ncbi:protein-L-isoaspartate(D-aspartate) O-methyltransferase [Candidatus Saccharibacteria bacterium]|nr:protein-L-isoaspartate(D-aspartate) O-methyltransferase [Candidatus Saccharibacteria bacterium]